MVMAPLLARSALLILVVVLGVTEADVEPRSYFSASLTVATTYDAIQGTPRTSTGTLYYDSTLPATRFEAHTTPDNDGDSTCCPLPFILCPNGQANFRPTMFCFLAQTPTGSTYGTTAR
jgi:hypothetical protein